MAGSVKAVNVMIRREKEYVPRLGEEVETWHARLSWPGAPQTVGGDTLSLAGARHDGVHVDGSTLADVFDQLARLVRVTEATIMRDIDGAAAAAPQG